MTTWQKATALVPLALLSGAWTASLAVSSATASDTAAAEEAATAASLPDGSTVPSDAVEQPANISAPGEVAPGVPKGSEDAVVKSASTNGIPSAALAAYQRAAQVIDSADASCNIEWPLVAAIGRVESNHGRYGGNTLSAEGVSTPGIYGIPLDGGNGTQRITDTDAGQFDDDKQFDRAVGPMQFIPSTWSVVGVDGDGDGERDPQDIDDAALATAVYLCSGDEDLGERSGQESAVYRYNHSDDYVALVLSIADAYASGDYSAVPNNSTAPTTFTPSYGDSVMSGGTKGYTPPKVPAPRPGRERWWHDDDLRRRHLHLRRGDLRTPRSGPGAGARSAPHDGVDAAADGQGHHRQGDQHGQEHHQGRQGHGGQHAELRRGEGPVPGRGCAGAQPGELHRGQDVTLGSP